MPNVVILPIRFVFSGDTMRGARALAVRLRPRRRNGPHVGQRVHSYNACLALPSHHQDASFTTSAALYGRTVASRRRLVRGAAGRPYDRHRLAQGSSHAVELGDELLVIVAPGGRSSASRHDELAVRSRSRLVIATSCGRCCGVASFGGACAPRGTATPRQASFVAGGACALARLGSSSSLPRSARQRFSAHSAPPPPDGQGEAGYHISRPPCALPEVVQRGRGPDAR